MNVVIDLLQKLLGRFDALLGWLNATYGVMTTKEEEWFQYQITHDFAAAWAAGAEVPGSKQISADAWFVVRKISAAQVLLTGDDTNSVAGQVIIGPVKGTSTYAFPDVCSGSFRLQLMDASGDRVKQDELIEAAAAIGPASHPTEVYKPWLLRAGGQVTTRCAINFAARHASDSLRVSVVLHGYKIAIKRFQNLTQLL